MESLVLNLMSADQDVTSNLIALSISQDGPFSQSTWNYLVSTHKAIHLIGPSVTVRRVTLPETTQLTLEWVHLHTGVCFFFFKYSTVSVFSLPYEFLFY